MYLVWNENSTKSEFYGATRSKERAERLYRKIRKSLYPGMSESEIEDAEMQNGECLKIEWFENLVK